MPRGDIEAASTDGEPAAVVRRAPFSDNPQVGARGLRTQQRILDAALEVFGEVGYDRCNIERIAKVAGCSRVSFYQYFSDKEDVFRQLAGQIARQLRASTEALEPVTPDAEGWYAIRAWVTRYAAIYRRYEPVFSAFPIAVERDETLAGGSARAGASNFTRFQAKLTTAPLPPRQLEPVVALLLAMSTRALEIGSILRSARPDDYDADRVEDALTDVFHRALFGLDEPVNGSRPSPGPPRPVPFGKPLLAMLREADITEGHELGEKPALGAILDAGRSVLVRRGYYGARVDDIVAAAGVSRGAFYRYFENRDHLTRVLAARALRTLSAEFAGISRVDLLDASGRPALRRWLQRYNAVHVDEAAMTRVWVDAALQEATRQEDSAAIIDWGRRQMAHVLEPRGFGDTDIEALVLLALIDMVGARKRTPAEIDAATHIIVMGFFGR